MKFISYAVSWVRESLMHVLADQTRALSFPPKLFPVLCGPGGGADVSLSERWDRAAGVTAIDDEPIHQSELDELAAALHELDDWERAVVRPAIRRRR